MAKFTGAVSISFHENRGGNCLFSRVVRVKWGAEDRGEAMVACAAGSIEDETKSWGGYAPDQTKRHRTCLVRWP